MITANKKIYYFLTLASLFLFSCRDEDDQMIETPCLSSPIFYDDYSNLEVGNYWIYERVSRHKITNEEVPLNIIDSTYVSKDTTINNKTYFKLEGIAAAPARNRITFKFLRDSLHYIVDPSGNIHFSSKDSTTVFSQYYLTTPGQPIGDTISQVKIKMGEINYNTTTKAGNFKTKTFMEVYNLQGTWIRDTSKLYRKIKYAKDIGIVEEYFPPYLSAPTYEVRKLIRYGKN